MDAVQTANVLAGFSRMFISLISSIKERLDLQNNNESDIVAILAGVSSLIQQQNKFIIERLEVIQMQEYSGTFMGLSVRLGEYRGENFEQEWLVNIVSDSADLYGHLLVKYSQYKHEKKDCTDILQLIISIVYFRVSVMTERKLTYGVNRDINIIEMMTETIEKISDTYAYFDTVYNISPIGENPCSGPIGTLCLPPISSHELTDDEKKVLNNLEEQRTNMINLKQRIQQGI